MSGTFQILDLGGTFDYWNRVGEDWLESHDIAITLVNSEVTEFGPPTSSRISDLVGNACDMSGYEDNSFHLVHSNSVIEHVGRWSEMKCFAAEVKRLAPHYYVQTPYFWFPIDPHFYKAPGYHWLPDSWKAKLHQRFSLGHSRVVPDVDRAMRMVESNILLDRAQFRALFPDAEHQFEWLVGLPKSMLAIR